MPYPYSVKVLEKKKDSHGRRAVRLDHDSKQPNCNCDGIYQAIAVRDNACTIFVLLRGNSLVNTPIVGLPFAEKGVYKQLRREVTYSWDCCIHPAVRDSGRNLASRC